MIFVSGENDCQDKHRYEFNQKHWVGENLYHMTRIFAFYDEERDIGYHAENAVDEWYREIRYYTYPLTGITNELRKIKNLF